MHMDCMQSYKLYSVIWTKQLQQVADFITLLWRSRFISELTCSTYYNPSCKIICTYIISMQSCATILINISTLLFASLHVKMYIISCFWIYSICINIKLTEHYLLSYYVVILRKHWMCLVWIIKPSILFCDRYLFCFCCFCFVLFCFVLYICHMVFIYFSW